MNSKILTSWFYSTSNRTLVGGFVEEGMTKCFRSDDLNQSLLMPPSLHDWLPENHLARFVADLVETLGVKPILS